MKRYDVFATIESTKNDSIIKQTVIITVKANSQKEAYDLIKGRCFDVVSIDNVKEA